METDSAPLLTEIASIFGDYGDFEWHPVLPAQETAEITARAKAWVVQTKQG